VGVVFGVGGGVCVCVGGGCILGRGCLGAFALDDWVCPLVTLSTEYAPLPEREPLIAAGARWGWGGARGGCMFLGECLGAFALIGWVCPLILQSALHSFEKWTDGRGWRRG
jgi:hypothetical protein